MEGEFDLDIDIEADLVVGEDLEKRSCITCRSCEDLCSGCDCLWKFAGAKCTNPDIPLPFSFPYVWASLKGSQVSCEGWKRS